MDLMEEAEVMDLPLIQRVKALELALLGVDGVEGGFKTRITALEAVSNAPRALMGAKDHRPIRRILPLLSQTKGTFVIAVSWISTDQYGLVHVRN